MDVGTIDMSEPRARQLRDEPQSGRYSTREYQQRQPSLERGVADQTDLKISGRKERAEKERPREAGSICPLDRDSHINDRGSAAASDVHREHNADAAGCSRLLGGLVN